MTTLNAKFAGLAVAAALATTLATLLAAGAPAYASGPDLYTAASISFAAPIMAPVDGPPPERAL
jgi:hypothetical protein